MKTLATSARLNRNIKVRLAHRAPIYIRGRLYWQGPPPTIYVRSEDVNPKLRKLVEPFEGAYDLTEASVDGYPMWHKQVGVQAWLFSGQRHWIIGDENAEKDGFTTE